MVRYDLAFLLCCCKSFLGTDENEGSESSDYYALLNIDRDASLEEIKKSFKRQSLQFHPDKLQQRGITVTEELQARFTRLKQAYEVLSDEHKRETYDAIGERGMKWIEEPFSVDPQELAHNFANSSVVDRSKIFAIFVAVAIILLILPVLICLQVDGVFGQNAYWTATMTPLWLWNLILMFYYTRLILMGPLPRPEHIPEEEWQDPLPMQKRYFSLVRFLLMFSFQLLVSLKLDDIIQSSWTGVFCPLLIWEATLLYKKITLAQLRIVTVEDLELALGKTFAEFTPEEKELIGQRYSIVPSTTSPQFAILSKLKARARRELMKCGFRIVFVVLLLLQLDGRIDLSWWFVFLPIWIMIFAICYTHYKSFEEVKEVAVARDPTLFGLNSGDVGPTSNYGTVGKDGEATPTATAPSTSQLSDSEREELKAQVMASSSKLCSKCCSQGFLLVLLILFVAKLQGASFSSFWIISPFLFGASLILCCLGCAIFGITEVNTDGIEFDTAHGDIEEHNAGIPSQSSLVVDDTIDNSQQPANVQQTSHPVDPEIGVPCDIPEDDSIAPPPNEANDGVESTSQIVDLLDDRQKLSIQDKTEQVNAIDELD